MAKDLKYGTIEIPGVPDHGYTHQPARETSTDVGLGTVGT